MTITNKPFILFEGLMAGWVVSHTLVNEMLQTTLLIVSIVAGIIGIYKSIWGKKK